MSIQLRVFLIACSVVLLYFVMRRIRKSSLEIEDSIYWLAIAAVLIIIAIFPQIAYWLSGVLGIASPANLVFFSAIVLLLVRTFKQDQKISVLKKKLIGIAQQEALRKE